MKYTILIVDDEAANLRMLDRLLSTEYDVLTADSGISALEILEKKQVAMIISDQRMPVMTGIEFLKRAAAIAPQAVRMIITGYTDAEALVEALNSGVVYKYITKPWINSDLKTTVNRGLQHHETLKAQRILQENYTKALGELDEARKALSRFASALLHLIDQLGHARSTRIAHLSAEVGKIMGMTVPDIEAMQLSILLRSLLSSTATDHNAMIGNQVEDGLRTVKKFEAGMKMMGDVPYLRSFVGTVRHFTERYDGTGYPNRLFGDSIPLIARIAAVVIAYDEMTVPRYDKPKYQPADAMEKIVDAAGTKYDPEVVDALSTALGPISRPKPAEMSPASANVRNFV